VAERFTDWNEQSVHTPYYFGKTSVIMPCQNRNEFLLHSVPAWLAQTYQRFELVIVDYNSERAVYGDLVPIAEKFGLEIAVDPPLKHIDDEGIEHDRYHEYSKLTIIQVPDVQEWNMSHAINYAVRRTTSDVLSIVGCDTVPDARYLEMALHIVDERVVSSVHCGRLTFPRALWYQLNGYQELCSGWGYEDNDFRFRLTRNNIIIKEMNPLMCPSVTHASLRGNSHDSNMANKYKCRNYCNTHGLIGNYSVFPGAEKPVEERKNVNHSIWIAKLHEPVEENELLTHQCCYAGKIDKNTIFFIVQADSSENLFTKNIEEKTKSIKIVNSSKDLWELLDLVYKREWREKFSGHQNGTYIDN